ncbi:hypothetical protein Q5P01_000445 [Channa striata]|uniref:UBC core domain-containing protein n=1 Tax=Channa striata TaxID=64152 RepID=A0AA88LF55_CHASR|nr:hypothetical protein Q5P01_000445 [Channa striata]
MKHNNFISSILRDHYQAMSPCFRNEFYLKSGKKFIGNFATVERKNSLCWKNPPAEPGSGWLTSCPLLEHPYISSLATSAVPLMWSFLILSNLDTPKENFNIFISAASISASCTSHHPFLTSSFLISAFSCSTTSTSSSLLSLSFSTFISSSKYSFHLLCTLSWLVSTFPSLSLITLICCTSFPSLSLCLPVLPHSNHQVSLSSFLFPDDTPSTFLPVSLITSAVVSQSSGSLFYIISGCILLQQNGEKIPNCTEDCLKETSLKKAADIEKILLSVHPSITTYHLWIGQESVTGQNFHLNTKRSFGSITAEMKAFPHLNVTPPLALKDLGCPNQCLVFLNEDNLGVYLQKNKLQPEIIEVYDCLSGKVKHVDVNVLAALTGDHRDDYSFITTRTPKEAILVLIDTSSSMKQNCYGTVKIQKIHAVKQLVDNFAMRSMAYDFHHVIGLVKFDSTVTMLHTFTDTLEKFKEKVHTLEVGGRTMLYDALQYGVIELGKVKEKFPNCRLRILCLTDGEDIGSSNKPAAVEVNLIKANITVDSVLVGKGESNILYGISIATGGGCFKPETSKDGLRLFEIETVLSLEMRIPKNKLDPSSITETHLRSLAIRDYDEFPEAVLPSQMKCNVTLTESALKTRIREAKDGRFMEKDKRILEELKSLHCQPHPYVTIFPSESDFTFWKILMEGPPDTPYEKGVFELFCQFGPDYPEKPPTVRFVTRIYHCNINSVGRICHNIFDRNYNAHITMRDILDAVYGLLIAPEPQDPLDSILSEEFLTSHVTYEEQAKRHTEKTAGQTLDDLEKTLVGPVKNFIPQQLICPLTKKIFVDPVKTKYGTVYERKAIEKHLKSFLVQELIYAPLMAPKKLVNQQFV